MIRKPEYLGIALSPEWREACVYLFDRVMQYTVKLSWQIRARAVVVPGGKDYADFSFLYKRDGKVQQIFLFHSIIFDLINMNGWMHGGINEWKCKPGVR